MRSLVVAAFALAACGNVNKAVDAGPPDAYVPDSGSPACGAGEMLCNNTCANVMTSEEYCGNCTTRCNPLQACETGACVSADTCARVRDANPGAGDGIYASPTNTPFYCDFTNSVQYDQFAMGLATSTPSGYTLVTPVDLQNAGTQKAFIALYNLQGGMPVIATFTGGNCCFAAGANYFTMAGAHVFPANATASVCAQAYNVNTLFFFIPFNHPVATTPIPADYFTTNPVSSDTACSASANPGIFMKKRSGLM